MTRTTIYAARRFQSMLAALLLALLGLIAHSHGADALAVSLGVVAVAAAAFLFRRPRLEIAGDGLTVVNFARTYRLPWTDVAGFGFGSARTSSCLAIRRRDGNSVNVIAVSDDFRSGYAPRRVNEVVADLQRRLRARCTTWRTGMTRASARSLSLASFLQWSAVSASRGTSGRDGGSTLAGGRCSPRSHAFVAGPGANPGPATPFRPSASRALAKASATRT